MIRKLVFWLVLVPLAIVILMFAIANREMVTVSFDPFSPTEPAASVSVPLFVLIFVLVILGVVIGGIAAWLRQGKHRRAARLHHSHVVALKREVDSLNTRLTDTPDIQSGDRAARLAYRPKSN
ncbi:MAG: LapA family protein [Pseudorhodoplanes sp.]